MLYIEGTISCSILLGTTEGLGFGSSFLDQTRERVPQTASRTRLNGIRTQHPNKKTTMAETPLPHHEIPSLPATPEPKRTKYTEPAANLTVACTFPNPPPVNTTYTYCTSMDRLEFNLVDPVTLNPILCNYARDDNLPINKAETCN